MEEHKLFKALKARFETSSLLSKIPLLTTLAPDHRRPVILVDIFHRGRGCFDVVFVVYSRYDGLKEQLQIETDIREILSQPQSSDYAWRHQTKEKTRISLNETEGRSLDRNATGSKRALFFKAKASSQ